MSGLRITSMQIFTNGNIAAFDEVDAAVPELGLKNSIELWAERAAALGYNIDGCEVELPSGSKYILRHIIRMEAKT